MTRHCSASHAASVDVYSPLRYTTRLLYSGEPRGVMRRNPARSIAIARSAASPRAAVTMTARVRHTCELRVMVRVRGEFEGELVH